MTMDAELVAIGFALLGIILGTWVYLHRIEKKLDRLLFLSRKEEKHSNYTNSAESND